MTNLMLFVVPHLIAPTALAAAGAATTGPADAEANLIDSGFWTSWTDLGNILLTVIIGYVVLVGAIRLLGKRTASKMSNSD